MNRILFFLFAPLLFCSMTAAQDTGKKYAVLVGIDDYVQMTKLRFTKNDIEALRDELYEIGFEKENVHCLTCGGEAKNLPTKDNIDLVIKSVLEMAEQGDIVIIAMNGHGIEVAGEPKFCPMDTKKDNLLESTISINGVFADFKKSKATFKLMLVDACRENPFHSRSATATAFQTIDNPPEGVMLLQSCANGEESQEDPALKRGVFTHYLVEGLQGKAADTEGQVTLMGLAAYASKKTQNHVMSEFRAWQRPSLKGEINDFVLKVMPVKLPKDYLAGSGAKFVRMEAGEFMMGDTLTPEEVDKKYPGGDVKWYEGAHPRHKVKISRPFFMAAHQVTVGEFRQFVNAAKYQTTAEKEGKSWGGQKGEWINGLNWKSPGFEQTPQHPVVCISWHDAKAYVDWMNKTHLPEESWAKGWRYALPTEAQWEYACRAGTTTDFFWGDTAEGGKGYLNAVGKEGILTGSFMTPSFPFDDGYKATAPVGTYKPNKWGLYDMHGNAWEWCSDWYGTYSDRSVTDPTGPATGSGRVIRGGGWHCIVTDCRSSFRAAYDPTFRCQGIGFRLVLTREEPSSVSREIPSSK